MIILSMKKSAAALAALAVLSAAPLAAQPEPQAQRNRIPVEDMRSYGATASAHNERLMAEVLRDFGFGRVTARQQERLDDARYRLFPDQSPRQRLNRTQAIALVYTALVYPRGTGAGGGRGWDDGRDGWDDGRGGWDDGRGRDRPREGRCVEIDRGIYEMLNLVSGEGQFGFVDEEEKVKIRATATQVQSAAIARNYRLVADRAVDVMASLTSWGTQRSVVQSRINSLKDAADQACGDDGRR